MTGFCALEQISPGRSAVLLDRICFSVQSAISLLIGRSKGDYVYK